MEWDAYFILEAYTSALKSKDIRTQVGACIVGIDRGIRSKGYNGPCRGEDDTNPEIFKKPLKHFLFEHAERNAVFNLARHGVSGDHCTMYCTLHPCIECARAIVQTGIVEVVLHHEFPGAHSLNPSQLVAHDLLERIGIPVRWVSCIPPIISILSDGVAHHFHK